MNNKLGIMTFVGMLLLLFGVSGATTQNKVPTTQGIVNGQTALGTAFTYQGHLKNGGGAVNGNCDMAFRLFDSASGGNQIGSPITTTVSVINSLFTVPLDFGGGVFNGDARYLQIGVKCGSDVTFSSLSPRQELTAAPYALYAVNNVPLSGGTMTGDLTTTRLKSGSPSNLSCDGNGDICAQDDLVADDNVVAGNNVYANADVTQARTGNGTIKAAVYALCNNPASTMRRYFNNVNGATITISNGPSLGICTIDFGFQVDDRYIVATATHPTTQLGVTVLTVSGNTAQFLVWHAGAGGAAAGGDIYVVVY